MGKPEHTFVDEHDCLQDATTTFQRHRWHFYSESERQRAEDDLCRHFAATDLENLQATTGLTPFREREGGMYVLGMEWIGIHRSKVDDNAMAAKQVVAGY